MSPNENPSTILLKMRREMKKGILSIFQSNASRKCNTNPNSPTYTEILAPFIAKYLDEYIDASNPDSGKIQNTAMIKIL